MTSFYANSVPPSAVAHATGAAGHSNAKTYVDVQASAAPPSKLISKWIKGVKRDFIPLTIRSDLYEAPKPDTPPATLWPFGYDPIWSEDILSPPIDLVRKLNRHFV